MKRMFLLLVAGIFAAFNTFATHVSPRTAVGIAERFMAKQIPAGFSLTPESIRVAETFIAGSQENPLYYLFNMNPDGWIAVAADDAIFPILAYSFTGSFDETRQAPQFKAWMKQYEDQIRYAIRENVPPYPKTKRMWGELTDAGSRIPDPGSSQKSHPDTLVPRPSSFVPRSVEPLITTRWNQSPWYNELCPPTPTGGHCPAGCVPVCMAQVMYYFRWPVTGVGSYTYTEPTYGELSADFGATTYRWDEMTNVVTSSNPAVAELLYHLGISCDLQYTPTGSGMYNHKAAYSLRTWFKYSPETRYLYRDSTTLNWDSVLIAHLDRKIPMYYAGWSLPNVDGHAFVCDGYQDSCFFHFNFGWGGSSDGYFYTSDLTPGGYNFNLAQEVVINCYPDTLAYTYPVQCSGDRVFTRKSGSFEDGSGPVDSYLPTANCSWLIDPQTATDSVSGITLNFDRFATNPLDFVTIYDGASIGDPVLGSFSGDQVPQSITSTGNRMFIVFEAGADPPANGFLANYKATMPVWCSGTTSIKSDSAELSDGSLHFNYYNNSLCKWRVETESGGPLTIHFKSFDTEEGKDFLTIYDLTTEDTLVSLSGYYPPDHLPDSVTAPGGKMYFIFSTNGTVTAEGWEIYYPGKSNIGVDEPDGISDLQIFPNPASDQVSIRFFSRSGSAVRCAVMATDGRLIREITWDVQPGRNIKEMYVNNLHPGIYLLRIIGEHETFARKLIVQ